MPVGVVPHYRPIACWSVATQTAILLVECRCKKDGYKSNATFTSDMAADLVPLSDMPACTMQLCRTCMMGSFTRVCKVLIHQARNLVCYKSIRHAYR